MKNIKMYINFIFSQKNINYEKSDIIMERVKRYITMEKMGLLIKNLLIEKHPQLTNNSFLCKLFHTLWEER